ncbi:MAG: WYL domain-containing protein, partial [bacterium]|nr:WYL domain-containing protein [bacterium]
STLEKITAYFLNNRKTQNNNLYIDFTSFKESKNIKENFPVIESAIKNNQLLEFDYTSSTHNFTHRLVEPVTIAFKWHAWYLIAYCRKRSDFRLFCISRIRNIIKQNSIFKIREINIEDFFSLSKIHPENNVINLILRFNEEIKVAIEDFFPNGTITENPDNYTLQVTLPKNEQYWLGKIMSFGNKVEIIEPAYLRETLLQKIEEISFLYKS